MARFERSREGRDSKSGFSNREPRGRNSFEDRPRGRRPSSRDSGSFGRNRREVEMTKVTCSSCGEKCEVPFKPTSNKPVYCKDCFSKKDNGGSNGNSNKDFEIINEKLDKIMKALEIE